MFTISSSIVFLAAIVAILAIHQGGRGKSRVHLLSAMSGAVTVLCIAALPSLLIKSLLDTSQAPLPQQAGFVVYLAVALLSCVTALVCGLRLVFSRRQA